MKEYYELLGLTESATDEEIENRYKELREKYREARWQDGEAGNEASRMLTKIETAYAEIVASRKEQEKKTDSPVLLEEVSRNRKNRQRPLEKPSKNRKIGLR